MKRKVGKVKASNIKMKNFEKHTKYRQVQVPLNYRHSELSIFTKKSFESQFSLLKKQINQTIKHKNVELNELHSFNDIVKDELIKCKANNKEKDARIKSLEDEKEDFKKITFDEVEKFEKTFQSQINDLNADNKKLKDEIFLKDDVLKNYEKQVLELKKLKCDANDDIDHKKNDKLVKKYRDLKGKIKALDVVLSENEAQKKDLRKHIEAKDELIKLKDNEILDFDKKLSEEISKSAVATQLKDKIKTLDQLLADYEHNIETKDAEIEQLKMKLKEDTDLNSIQLNILETKINEKDHKIEEMIRNHEEALTILKSKNKELEDECRGLNTECKVMKEASSKVKSEKRSEEELKEDFHLQFKEAFAEKEGHIRELEERNGFICKENEELRIDMRKLIEKSYTQDNLVEQMKRSVTEKNCEISELKSKFSELKCDLENQRQMLARIIEKKNMKLKEKDLIIEDRNKQLSATVVELRPESEKRLGAIIKALEASNSNLEKEITSLKQKQQQQGDSGRDYIIMRQDVVITENKISEMTRIISGLKGVVTSLRSKISNLEQDLQMQKILLEETERDRDYFEKMWKEITDLVETEAAAPFSDKVPDYSTTSLPMITYLWPVVPWTPPQPLASGWVTCSDNRKRKVAEEDVDEESMAKKVKHILDLCDRNTITLEYYDADNDVIILE